MMRMRPRVICRPIHFTLLRSPRSSISSAPIALNFEVVLQSVLALAEHDGQCADRIVREWREDVRREDFRLQRDREYVFEGEREHGWVL